MLLLLQLDACDLTIAVQVLFLCVNIIVYFRAFLCECGDTGYEGPQCEDDVNECVVGTPCLHAGKCR